MSSPEQDRAAHRRKLIKAAVAMPAVFTLPSGAALAATSTQCSANSLQAYEQSKPATFAGTTDTWVRLKLERFRIHVNAGSGGWKQIDAFRYPPATGPWYQVVDDGSRAVQVTATVFSGGGSKNPASTGTYYYGLLDYKGETSPPELLLQQGNGINPIAGGSCWTSLTGVDAPGNILLG